MDIAEVFGLVSLCLTWGAQVFIRSFLVRYVRAVFFTSAVVVFVIALYFSYLQYFAWQENSVTKFFLPPYQGVGYFIEYVGSRIVGEWVIAFLAALLLGFTAHRLNRRFGERFLEPEEPWFLALGVFLSGYPGFLFYMILMLFFGLLFSTFYFLLSRGRRAPLYFVWLPMAVLAIIVEKLLIPHSTVVQFRL